MKEGGRGFYDFESGAVALAQLLESGMVNLVDRGQMLSLTHRRVRLRDASDSIRQPRSRDDVEREFGLEKWGALFQWLAGLDRPTVDDADEEYLSKQFGMGCLGDKFFTGSELALHRIYAAEIRSLLLHQWHGEPLVDLGSGYGSIALSILSDPAFRDLPSMHALELTRSGRDCIRILGSSFPQLRTGHCDFEQDGISQVKIPAGAVVMTSMATMYLPSIPDALIRDLLALSPARVVHFEPQLRETARSELSRLRARYLVANGYNRDLLDQLRRHESLGLIRILDVGWDVVGESSLLPATMVIWEPA